MTQGSGPDPKDYRRLFGRFATGVTVIVTQTGDEIHGMTANAVTSLSLEPLLLLVCVDKGAHMAETLQQAGAFSVNILRHEQELLSRYFAGGGKRGMRRPEFRFVPWEGAPRLGGCLASFACQVHDMVEGGDHWIVVGRVVALHEGEPPLNPLLFFSGGYRQLDPDKRDPAPELESGPIPIHIYYDMWHDDMK